MQFYIINCNVSTYKYKSLKLLVLVTHKIYITTTIIFSILYSAANKPWKGAGPSAYFKSTTVCTIDSDSV